jgi:hypothetical protein
MKKLYLASKRVNSLRYKQALLRGDEQMQLPLADVDAEIVAESERHGPAILKDYGWAAVELGRVRVSFRDLEALVEHEHARANVRLASFRLHVNHLWPTQLLGHPKWEANVPIIGPSPCGIQTPLMESVRSLALFILDLPPDESSLDIPILTRILGCTATSSSRRLAAPRGS